jgi:hypothetical protein
MKVNCAFLNYFLANSDNLLQTFRDNLSHFQLNI